MRHRYHLADVFTDRIFGGNPLAVFPDASTLHPRYMQPIARELNLSETVFVLPPADPEHTRRLRIFTPGTELPFAGHPTVGCAHVLAATGALPAAPGARDWVFEEGVGPVRVSLEVGDEGVRSARLWAAQRPQQGPAAPPPDAVAEMLCLAPSDLAEDGSGIEAFSCGVPFLLVPLASRAAVARARLRPERWEALLASFWAPHVYVFSRDPERADADLHARMFAPAMGIAEDPATGAAAAALGGYLGRRASAGTGRWRIEQGMEMGRPSLLELEVDVGAAGVEAVRVGGGAVLVAEGTLEVPD